MTRLMILSVQTIPESNIDIRKLKRLYYHVNELEPFRNEIKRKYNVSDVFIKYREYEEGTDNQQ